MKWKWLLMVGKYIVKFAPGIVEAILQARAEAKPKPEPVPAPAPPPGDIEK